MNGWAIFTTITAAVGGNAVLLVALGFLFRYLIQQSLAKDLENHRDSLKRNADEELERLRISLKVGADKELEQVARNCPS